MNEPIKTQFELLAHLVQVFRETEYASEEIKNRKQDEDSVIDI